MITAATAAALAIPTTLRAHRGLDSRAAVAPHRDAGRGPAGRPPAPRQHQPPSGIPTVFPFAPAPALRRPNASDALPEFWQAGGLCAVGCRPYGAIDGWPLKPFHRQHALRAGLDERRPSGFHVGIDIQAPDRTPVYAVQPGVADIVQATGDDSRVQVGNYIYWHIHPAVSQGQYVRPYSTVVGHIVAHAGHLHLSEVTADGTYLNPLRPGGRVLYPYSDTAPPVIGRPMIQPNGDVDIAAFDPQSFQVRTTYETPVLAPAALAYAVFDQQGRRIGSLRWAFNGADWLQPYDVPLVFTPTAHEPGWNCFATQVRCIPDWSYHLAGAFAPALTALGLPPGTYRLTAYAWDWAGNETARDVTFQLGPGGATAVAQR